MLASLLNIGVVITDEYLPVGLFFKFSLLNSKSSLLSGLILSINLGLTVSLAFKDSSIKSSNIVFITNFKSSSSVSSTNLSK